MAASSYLRELAAPGCSSTTLRSYAYALLRWFRYLDERLIPWQRAERIDVREFVEHLREVPNPQRLRRHPDGPPAGEAGPGSTRGAEPDVRAQSRSRSSPETRWAMLVIPKVIGNGCPRRPPDSCAGCSSATTPATTHGVYTDFTCRQNTGTVQRCAREGGVIVGRNAAFLLSDWPTALHVKLDWPLDVGRPPLDLPATTPRSTARHPADPGAGAADGPGEPILDPEALSDAAQKQAENGKKKDHPQERGSTGPAPSGMTGPAPSGMTCDNRNLGRSAGRLCAPRGRWRSSFAPGFVAPGPAPAPPPTQRLLAGTSGADFQQRASSPYDHSPSGRRVSRTPSNGATGSAGCSTSISRSCDVCSVSDTHRHGPRRCPPQLERSKKYWLR
jgi:Phage integrase, N-terminal SAM-like domain